MSRLRQIGKGIPFKLFLASLAYSVWQGFCYGRFPGANYDSYQYVYAVMRGSQLTANELSEFARLHVHSGYFPIWRLLSRCGLPVWETVSWLNIGCTAATVACIYALSRQQGSNHRFALTAALLFQSFSTVAYYADIPEVYAPWMLCLALTLIHLDRQQGWPAAAWFSLATWIFLQSVLLWPAFLWLRGRRKWPFAAAALGGGLTLHWLTLRLYSIPFFSRLASERVYWQVATGWRWYLTSTWESLTKSGMAWAALACLLLACLLNRRLTAANRRLLLLALPLFLAPALWVKDHGSFFLPFGLVISLLLPRLLQRAVGHGRWISNVACAALWLLIVANLRGSRQVVAYDRAMGQSQVEFCQQALIELPPNSRVLSTALLSTWLWAKEEAGRDDVECRYFPWLLRQSYGAVMEQSLQALRQTPGTYFVDPTVSSLVTEAGKILAIQPIAVPYWPSGQVYWDLTAVYLDAGQP